MNYKRLFICLGLFFALLFLPSLSQGMEVIRSFHSSIQVDRGGIMTVTEDITVNVENVNITHGIYRDFPTTYKDRDGNMVKVGFRVFDIYLDGVAVAYKVTNQQNGVRIRIGDADTIVPRGSHTYSITYETTEQLGFFEDHDELYWNVTGNGWKFPIEKASASVSLPEGTPLQNIIWFTGRMGSKEKAGTGAFDGNRAEFSTTRILLPGEGFTIAAAWPKGYVIPDENYYKAMNRGRYMTLVGRYVPILAIILVLAYYLTVWFLHGKDLRPGRIIPLFYPPEKVNPATASFLVNQGYVDEAFTSTVIDLAVRGYMVIEELGSAFSYYNEGTFANGHLGSLKRFRSRITDKTYILKRTEKGEGLNMIEGSFLSLLFPYGNTLVINQSSREALREAKKFLVSDLKGYCLPLVKKNIPYVVTGIALTILIMGGAGLFLANSGGNIAAFGFMTAWLSMWTVGVSALVYGVYKALREGFQKNKGSAIFRGIFMGAFSIPFIFGQVAGMGIMARSTSIYFALAMIAALVLNVLFARWMKNYTPIGRAIMDKLNGFEMYLRTAERERIKRFAQVDMPEDTPEQFEKMLPYAIALNVEKQWAERFSHVLEVSNYQPGWYVGPGPYFFYGPDSFASSLSNGLSGAVSSASTPPGSSSGFGGGGSSGGGGGGGGGGGW